MRGEKVLVIADDITGAAEIAGIASSCGRQVCLLVSSVMGVNSLSAIPASASVLVIATDTRSMSEADAVSETRRVVSLFFPSPLSKEGNRTVLFKKTDSALRGHVEAELQALLQATGKRKAVYAPANPSKGRIVRGGIYYIKEGKEGHDVPIADTAFSYDPEFPARTSSLSERFPHAASLGISMPDVTSDADLRTIVAQADDDTILAGAADLFSCLLSSLPQSSPITPSSQLPLTPHLSPLIVCGSTQSRPSGLGIPVSPMPLNVYGGDDDIAVWLTDATALYCQGKGLVLSIPHHHLTGKAVACHLRAVMARMVAALLAVEMPSELVIEGGATAFAALQQLGWSQLTVVQEIAPGVVRLQAERGTCVTLKPGSYPWGPLFG